jgi:hypothetical protein
MYVGHLKHVKKWSYMQGQVEFHCNWLQKKFDYMASTRQNQNYWALNSREFKQRLYEIIGNMVLDLGWINEDSIILVLF